MRSFGSITRNLKVTSCGARPHFTIERGASGGKKLSSNLRPGAGPTRRRHSAGFGASATCSPPQQKIRRREPKTRTPKIAPPEQLCHPPLSQPKSFIVCFYLIVNYPVAEFGNPKTSCWRRAMKWGQLLVPFLAVGISGTCLAQGDRPAVDRTQRAVTEARNAGRFMDAEKLLTDAIHELEQSDPRSPRLAQYLKELAPLLHRRGRDVEAAAAMDRAYEIDRNAFGPNDLRITDDLVNMAWSAHTAGNDQEAERLLNQALEIVPPKRGNLRWNAGAGLAAGVLGAVVSFYIAEKRWVSAELLMPEETKLCDMLPEEFRTGFGLCGRIPETLEEIYRGEGRAVAVEERPRSTILPPELTALNQ